MYNKLFTKILDSSIWLEPTSTRIVWITILAAMDQDGYAHFSAIENLAGRARVTTNEAAEAVRCFLAPDPNSANPENEGRRIERVPGGYIVLNAGPHRNMINREIQREQTRLRVAKHRANREGARNVTLCNDKQRQTQIQTATALSGVPPDWEGDGVSLDDTIKKKPTTGFGVATVATPPNDFDVDAAAALEKAVRRLPQRKTGINGAKPSTWIEHLRLLRVKDKIPQKDISRVMEWYTAHIGEEFVPMAFSGEAFRKKWEALERACDRDKIMAVTEITPQAIAVADRLKMLGWPKGSAKTLPGATQACLTAYAAWSARRTAFTARLEAGNLLGYTKDVLKRLLSFGRHLKNIVPGGEHFVDGWLRGVHGRVHEWVEWNGNLNYDIFTPTHKRFTAIGRGWAQAYANDSMWWDQFIEAMNKEGVK